MSTTLPSSLAHRTPPILIAIIGVMLGCIMDAMVKTLGAAYGVVLIATGRYVFGSIFSGAAVVATKARLPGAAGMGRHAVRAMIIATCSVLFFNCLSILPIAEATVLIFCAPLMIAPLARLILGEKIRAMAAAALAIGFVGMLVTVQGANSVGDETRRLEGVLSGFGAAALYALSMVLLRRLARNDGAVTTAFLSNLFPAIYLLPVAIFLGAAPAAVDLPLFAATGLTGFFMWFMLTAAYSRAPAQDIAPAEYTALIWSALLGYVFFAELPRWQVWAGAGVIVLAVMMAAWDSRRAEQRAAAAKADARP
ncbi:MAG: DMT family transporter [Hyphomonadaceae bacterium]